MGASSVSPRLGVFPSGGSIARWRGHPGRSRSAGRQLGGTEPRVVARWQLGSRWDSVAAWAGGAGWRLWVAAGWHACISCAAVPTQPLPLTGHESGIDLGIESFAALSNGTRIFNPGWYRKAERALKTAQRRVTRRNAGAIAGAKAVTLPAKAPQQVRRQRQTSTTRRRWPWYARTTRSINGLSTIYQRSITRTCSPPIW